jgi:hypothetical protein
MDAPMTREEFTMLGDLMGRALSAMARQQVKA